MLYERSSEPYNTSTGSAQLTTESILIEQWSVLVWTESLMEALSRHVLDSYTARTGWYQFRVSPIPPSLKHLHAVPTSHVSTIPCPCNSIIMHNCDSIGKREVNWFTVAAMSLPILYTCANLGYDANHICGRISKVSSFVLR